MYEEIAMFGMPLAQFGSATLTLGHVVFATVAIVVISFLALAFVLIRSSRARALAATEAALRAQEAEQRMRELTRVQAELHGRLGTMAEIFGSRQAELTKALSERLDGMTSRLGHSITEQTKSTHENLAKLQERLAVIDTAQSNIQSLAGQVVQLQQILSNKQTRGAFGQARMEAIIADGLPASSYEFQATLSNGNRPDCLIRMPNGAPSLVIDAKFPLEAWNAIRAAAESEGGLEAKRAAEAAFKRDIEVHIKAISEKYLINGETQETAFMFVPSESIFAEIHENYEALVQRAHRVRVVIVSPSLLMLSIQVIQAVLKDARMREQAHLIQAEVAKLMVDVSRLDERVRKLQGHFFSAQKDVELILTSADKVTKRGVRIEALELGAAEAEEPRAKVPEREAEPTAASLGAGQLRLRVVEE
jgi:DNA recombination protein RmuC